jgi:hypothetical protein
MVRLESGREFRGILDARTDDHHLWLRWRIGEVELQRPIVWQRIVQAELNGEAIDVDDLRARSTELATPGRVTQLRQGPAEQVPAVATSVIPAVIRSIRCNAYLANWDADAEFDGLSVEIEAVDQFGNSVSAVGTIQAELVTLDYQPAYLGSTSGGRQPTSLGQWSRPWDSQHGAVQLELQGRVPQREGRLDRYALLKIRVTIPGSGVFEQQLDGLRMRPFTPVQNSIWR